MCLFIILLDCFYLSADLFVCVEVDSYGHYFRKAKSKLVCNSANPRWNEQFIIELEGSQNLRILLYEESQDRAILRAKFTQKVCNCIHSHDRVLLPMCKLHTSRIFIENVIDSCCDCWNMMFHWLFLGSLPLEWTWSKACIIQFLCHVQYTDYSKTQSVIYKGTVGVWLVSKKNAGKP